MERRRQPETLPQPGDRAGWLVVFGQRHEFEMLLLCDRAEAEKRLLSLARPLLYPVAVDVPP